MRSVFAPFGLRFGNPTLEAAFRDQHRRRSAEFVHTGLGIVFVFAGVLALYVSVDAWRIGGDFGYVTSAAFRRRTFDVALLMGLGALGGWLVPLRPTVVRAIEPLIVAIALVFVVAVHYLWYGAPAGAIESYGYAVLIVHMMNVALLFGLRVGWSAAAAAAVIVAYVVGALAVLAMRPSAVAFHATILVMAWVFVVAAAYQLERANRRAFAASEQAERLLLNILPASIAARLKAEPGTIADGYGDVTVLFSDIVGFTELSSRVEPRRLVEILNGLVERFDELADAHGVEKIKTIGDAYMAAAGLPEPRHDHAQAMLALARGMLRAVAEFDPGLDVPLAVRIGLHSGPVVAGVIGTRKFSYDLWGDTVNTASRMESHGVAGRIQVSAATHALLRDDVEFEARGELEIKGKGPMAVWLVAGADGSGD